MKVCWISLIVAAVALFVFAQTATASYTFDRQYRLGDDPADEFGSGAVAGNPVTVTVDSFATSPRGDQQDMLSGSFINMPTYTDVSTVGTGRPGAVSGDLGVEFHGPDGVGDGDHLVAARLGAPDTSAASTGHAGPLGAGPLDYSGITHRGFQAWVYPTNPGSGLQDVIMDTLAHGVRIGETGTWVMRYWGDGLDYDTGVAVTDDWHHVQVVQAPRTAGALAVHEARQTLCFEAAHPVGHGARCIAQQLTRLTTAHALRDQQDAVQPMIVARLGGTSNLVLDRQDDGLGIGYRQLFHTRKITALANMRNYL